MNPGDALDAESLLRHGAWLAQLARALVANDDEIDDVVQQTYTQALAAPPRHATNLRSWLGAIARNVIRASRRSDAARVAREEIAPRPAPPETPDELVARAELRRAVVDAVLGLEEPYRTAILLRFFEEQEPAAIARITKAPLATVRTRIRRGVEQVRATLQSRAARGGDSASAAQALIFARLSEFAKGGVGKGLGAGSGIATAAGVTTIAAGGLVMSLATKLTMAAAILAGAALSVWLVHERGARTAESRGVSARTPAKTSDAPESSVAQSADRRPEPVTTPSNAVESGGEEPAVAAPHSDCVIRGVVRNATGEVQAGVEVVALIAGRYTTPNVEEMAAIAKEARQATSFAGDYEAPRPKAITKSDEAGRFTLAGLSDEDSWMVGAVDAEGDSAASDTFRFDPKRHELERDLTLIRVLEVSGRVVAPDGKPIGGALVQVDLVRDRSAGTLCFRTNLVGPDVGCWSGGRHAAASFRVAATAPGFLRTVPPMRVEIPAGRRAAEVEVVLQPREGVLMSGPIVDESGARVDLLARARAILGDVVIEDQGYCQLEVVDVSDAPPPEIGRHLEGDRERGQILLEEGSYEFRLPARWRGWIVLMLAGRVVGEARVDDVEHAPPLAFVVPPPEPPAESALVIVKVVDGSTGDFIDARTAAVDLEVAGSMGIDAPTRAPAGVDVADGAVAFVAPLARVRVSTMRRGFISTTPEVVLTRAGERREVTLTLSTANCGIRGRALNHDGSPIPSAEVSVYRAIDPGFEGVPVMPAETDADGSFHVRGLAPGEYTLVVSDGNDAPAVARATAAESPPTVELRSAEGERVHFRIVGPPAADGRTDMTFRIADASGLPVVNYFGAFVQSSWGATTFGATLVPGRYRVFVWPHGCREGSVEFDVPAGGTVDIPVERAR